MGQQQIRLCEHLVTSYYGHDTGQIASILLNRGRLSFANLVRLSGLPPKVVRAVLMVLIQQNCVYHSFVSDPSSSTSTPSTSSPDHFSASPPEILARLRFGKYSALAEEMFGEEGREVVERVLLEGKVRMRDLEGMLIEDPEWDVKRNKMIKSTMTKLLVERFLKPCHPHHTVNPTDRHMSWEQEFLSEIKGVATPKDLKAVKERLDQKIEVETEAEQEEMMAFGTSRKRKAASSGDVKPNKKHVVEEAVCDEDMFVRANFARFDIKIRNRLMEQACRHRFNKEASMVLRSMMSVAEAKQHSCADAVSPPVSVHSILQRLGDHSKDLRRCFPSTAADGDFNLSIKNSGDLTAEILSVLACEDDMGEGGGGGRSRTVPSLGWALKQMNPAPMVSEVRSAVSGASKAGGSQSKEWRIDYARYAVEMRKRLVDLMVRERWGTEAARLVKILMHRGKLDEKHLAKIALMSSKDVRELCLRLLSTSLIELQEVPRTANHDPSRTFYLFYVDFRKLCSQLLEDLYKAQANVQARKAEERRRQQGLVEKSARSDVKEDPKLLSVWERRDLERLESRMEALTVAENRIEADVFVLRDLPWLEGD